MRTSTIVRKKSLSEDDCKKIIEEYQKSMKKVLIDNGYIQVSDQFRIDIVRLKKRVHVLRGQTYNNHRSYKLKASMGYYFYKDIDDSFNNIALGD